MRTDSERTPGGWTLVELVVVLGISAILLVVAIPTLLGNRQGANDQAVTARLDAATGVLQEVWAEYHTFCVSTSPGSSGCSDASFTTAMNGLGPGTVADQTGGVTSATTPPAAPVALVRSATAVELGAEAVGRHCVYLEYLEAPSSVLPAGTWYATGPALADNGTACSLTLTPVSGWHRSWGQAGA